MSDIAGSNADSTVERRVRGAGVLGIVGGVPMIVVRVGSVQFGASLVLLGTRSWRERAS